MRAALAAVALAGAFASVALAQTASPAAGTTGSTPAAANPAPPAAGATNGAASASSPALATPRAVPSRSDTAMEAFGKLNRGNAGYLTYADVQHLDGFGAVFAQADQNGDGRLNPAEFNTAWALYTGTTP